MTGSPQSPLVTVIIPNFNCKAYIADAVDCALASTGVQVEIIVVDDESTDGSWEVLQAYGERITLLRQRRGGPYRARNLASAQARGKWLAFLDADDEWLPEKLAKQLELAHDPVAMVYTDRDNFGDLSRSRQRQSDSVTLYDGDVFEPLLSGNFITLSSVLIRKDWFESLGGFSIEQHGVQDWDLWLRYSAAGGRVALCREPLTRYRIHDAQMTNDMQQRARDRETVLRRALDSPRGQLVPKAVRRKALSSLWELAAWHAADQPSQAIRWYLKAASLQPFSLSPYKGVVRSVLRRK
jgi:glycosyltransferase involved in cell wall biosynthesis